MASTLEIGSILIGESAVMAQVLGLRSESFSADWSLVQAMNGFAVERKAHAAGWNFFFMAAEVKVLFLGPLGAKKIQNAVQRILGNVKGQHYNALEVTGIVSKQFLGVPYTSVSAHSRHLQRGAYLDGIERRRACQRDATWASG